MVFMSTLKAKYKIIGMAYSRSDFKNKVEEKIGGALYEYLKAEYAKANKETKWIDHWTTEVDRLIDTELVVVFLHSASFKNKKKAANEVVTLLKKNVKNYKNSAKKLLETSYFNRKHEITDDKIIGFFKRVEAIITPDSAELRHYVYQGDLPKIP